MPKTTINNNTCDIYLPVDHFAVCSVEVSCATVTAAELTVLKLLWRRRGLLSGWSNQNAGSVWRRLCCIQVSRKNKIKELLIQPLVNLNILGADKYEQKRIRVYLYELRFESCHGLYFQRIQFIVPHLIVLSLNIPIKLECITNCYANMLCLVWSFQTALESTRIKRK